MPHIKLAFQNMYQGMHFAGKNENGVDIFYKYNPSAYIEYFKDHKLDFLCLAEAPLDTKDGQSLFLDALSTTLDLPHYEAYVNEKSWVVEGKYYGTVILSRYAIDEYETFNLPNPKLEADQPDGSHWVMHDKGAQKAKVTIDGHTVNIYNLHYFPFGHFGRRMEEEEFHPIRQELANIVKPQTDEVAIVCGDFNNRGLEIEVAFPELFDNNLLERTISFIDFDESLARMADKTQVDHVLITSGISLVKGQPECNYSDHCGISVELEIK